MRVKLHNLMAGPQGIFQPGQIVDLDDATAAHLVRTGQAESAEPTPAAADPDPRPPATDDVADEETADAPAGPLETATRPTRRRRN